MQNIPTKNIRNNSLFWLGLFAFSCFFIYTLESVLMPFVAGIVIAYLLNPWANKLQKWGASRTLATILVLLGAILIIIPFLVMIIWVIQSQFVILIDIAPQYAANILKKVEPVLLEIQNHIPEINKASIAQYVSENMANGLKIFAKLTSRLISSGFAIVNLISLIVITPIVAFYMLRDWNNFIKQIENLLPIDYKADIKKQGKEIDKTISGFLRGQLSVCIILGTYYGLALRLVGLELGLMIGFLAGIISFIPYVGSISGFIISLILAFAQFSTPAPILMVVGVFLVGQFMEGNFLTPKLVGENVGLHPVWVMFALLAGGVLLGFLGLMIAVPMAAIVGVLLRHAIQKYKKSSLYR